MKQRSWHIVFTALVILAGVTVVQAGTIESVACNVSDGSWQFNTGSQALSLSLSTPGAIAISGDAVGDPSFNVSESIQNTTGIVWTSYQVILGGSGVQFDYTAAPTSDHFLSTSQQPLVLTYLAPNPVSPGDTVTLNYAISVANPGLFNFTLQQNPVPEPATIALLGLGSIVLRRKSFKR